MGKLVGYARVSTDDQNLDLQRDALAKVGCVNIYEEKVSGVSPRRPELDLCIKELQVGDTLVVWRLDRIARSVLQLYSRLEEVRLAGASFRSVTENFDFGTATGKLVLGFFAVIAEFERSLTQERTAAGMQARIERGLPVGAALKFTEAKRVKARKLLAETKTVIRDGRKIKRPKHTRRSIAKRLKISYQTLYVWIRAGKPSVKD
jgi:DNA invertase Pin-like site-specific DNA recombinase